MHAILSTQASESEKERMHKIAGRVRELFPRGCSRILLVNIPQVAEEDFDLATARLGRYPAFPPYGPGLLSRNLRNAGWTTKLLDLNFEVLSHLDEPFFVNRWESLLGETLESFAPDIVAVSCMFSMAHNSLKRVADYVKREAPDAIVIAGGVHVTNNTRLTLEEISSIDFSIRYEADEAVVNLVNFVNNKVDQNQLSQVAMLVDGKYMQLDKRSIPGEASESINLSPEYDELPIGAYSAAGKIGAYSWLRPGIPAGTILANRGCRAQCTFCSVRSFNGKGVRSRQTGTVVDELQRQNERYGIKHFMWLDDDLFGPGAVEMFNEIVRRNLDITWDATNGVIASVSTPEVMYAAAESGCIGLNFGIESGSPDILKAIKKPSGVKHFRRLGETLKKYPHIFSKGNLMVGFPDETVAHIQRTIELAKEINLDWYTVNVVSLLGGTEMGELLIKKGVVDEHGLLQARYFAGITGGQKRKEREERDKSVFLSDVLDSVHASNVPSIEQIPDVWFLMDFIVNYQRIPHETNAVKLNMKRLMLRDVCDHLPAGIPMASLFLGVVNRKLGRDREATANVEETVASLQGLAFWRVRFEKLGLHQLLADMQSSPL